MALLTKRAVFVTIALSIVLGLAFLISLRWFPPLESLRLIAALPFLLFVPGFFITQLSFRNYNTIEKVILSIMLSMLIISLALFAIERTIGKLTPFTTFTTTTAVNVAAMLLFVGSKFLRGNHCDT